MDDFGAELGLTAYKIQVRARVHDERIVVLERVTPFLVVLAASMGRRSEQGEQKVCKQTYTGYPGRWGRSTASGT